MIASTENPDTSKRKATLNVCAAPQISRPFVKIALLILSIQTLSRPSTVATFF